MIETMVTPLTDGRETPPILDDIWIDLVIEWRRNSLAPPLGIVFDRYEKRKVTVTFGSSVDLSTWAKHFKEPTRIVAMPKGEGWLTWAPVAFHGYNVVLEFCARAADIAPEHAPVTDAELLELTGSLPAGWIPVGSRKSVRS